MDLILPDNNSIAKSMPWYDEHGQFSANLPTNDEVDALPMPMVSTMVAADEEMLALESINTRIQTFYEGPWKDENQKFINWVEKQPMQIPEIAQARYNKAIVRIYKVKDYSVENTIGGLTPMKLSSITVSSPSIVAAIEPILAEEAFRPADKETMRFYHPFRELYFAYTRILEVADKQNPQTEASAHMKVFVHVLKDSLGERFAKVGTLQSMNQISFDYIWAIFPKDIIVYSRVDDADRLFQVVNFKWSTSCWQINCRFVQFNGVKFGMDSYSFHLFPFAGARIISDLHVYPIGFNPDPTLENRLLERGREVLNYQDTEYRQYVGIHSSLNEDDDGGEDSQDESTEVGRHYSVDGRVVIDAFSFEKFNPGLRMGLLKKLDSEEMEVTSTQKPRPSAKEQQLNKHSIEANRRYLLLMSPLLAGYSLKLKRWFWLDISGLRPLTWNESAYDDLVFPEERKNLLLSFVSNHKRLSEQHDDVIEEKGQGLVILLSGPPGTGKTLTAESVADKARRPLYHLHTEELGTTPNAIGTTLSKASALATAFNAVLLLDEADTLLCKRSVINKSQNGIISAVLHHLDNFRGILFLTTNLLSNMDDAFLSRMHLHLRYPSLSAASRVMLWEQFLLRAGSSNIQLEAQSRIPPQSSQAIESSNPSIDLSSEDMNALATWDLNGREIRNVVKTARLWCTYNNYGLTLDRIEAAIRVTAAFAEKTTEEAECQDSRKRQRLF